MESTHSYWEREEWLNAPDLLIAGGGIVGASVALFYKKRYPGHDILVIDKGVTPEGASTRNAGFACIGSISEHLADMQVSGEEIVLNRIARRWYGLELLREIAGDAAMEYEHTGGFEIFTNPETFDDCQKKIDDLNRQLEKRLGLEEVYSVKEYQGYPAIFNRVEGAINSGMLMRSLHQKMNELGVRTWWNCRVDEVGEKSVLINKKLWLKADQIVLAVNGFVSQLTDIPVEPARGYIFVTEPIQDLKWRGTFHYNEGYVYFRNIGERLLLGGGRNMARKEENTDQFGVNPKIKEYLARFAGNVLKLPVNWKIDVEWSGIMGMTADKEPVIKQIQPGIWAVAGLSGMGIAVGMNVARNLVEMIKS